MGLLKKIKKILARSGFVKNNFIEITHPLPYSYVGAKFSVSGWVQLSWFDSDYGGVDWRIFVDYIDLNHKNFMGGGSSPRLDDTKMKGDMVRFSFDCELQSPNIGFIQKSHGRITLKLHGPNKEIKPVYLPLIVKQFETPSTGDKDIMEKHSRIGETVDRYERELKEYNEEMKLIYESRKAKDEDKEYSYAYDEAAMAASDILKILDEDSESFEKYAYSEEDRREKELEEKYKDALEWRGPLAYGIVSKFGGFELRVYSDDHDKHFHVIHRGKGIDARFSFPDMRLMNYKNRKATIGSKAEKRIREYCLRPEIYKIFEAEFAKRN